MFRTELTPDQSPSPIKLGQKILSIGSCFADCMGQRLQAYKFDTLTNPFGVLFNPLSVTNLLLASLKRKELESDRIIERGGRFYHYDLHSSISGNSRKELMQKSNDILREVEERLHLADHLIITLGTAYVYRHLSTDGYVANCHKTASSEFEKELLQPKIIEAALDSLLNELSNFPAPPAITLTVSPVRHIKDTIPLNSVSKAILRLAAHNIISRHKVACYFPSYELMMDDLRDYRFYKEDMLHPTLQAEKYIWEKFVSSSFSGEAQAFVREWSKMLNAIGHRPLNPGSQEHITFLNKTISRLQSFNTKIDTDQEIKELKSQLLNYEKQSPC